MNYFENTGFYRGLSGLLGDQGQYRRRLLSGAPGSSPFASPTDGRPRHPGLGGALGELLRSIPGGIGNVPGLPAYSPQQMMKFKAAGYEEGDDRIEGSSSQWDEANPSGSNTKYPSDLSEEDYEREKAEMRAERESRAGRTGVDHGQPELETTRQPMDMRERNRLEREYHSAKFDYDRENDEAAKPFPTYEEWLRQEYGIAGLEEREGV